MSFKLRNVAALLLLTLFAWLARAGSAPAVSIRASPPNPTAGQAVHLHDPNADGNDGFFWSFGDGQAGQSAAVAHSWAQPGTYTVQLESQGVSAELPILVSRADTLRLNGAHPFEITAEAHDPNAREPFAGRAYAQNDKHGFFVFPAIAGDPHPEVNVKIVEAGWAGRYWILYGSLTSASFTLTARDIGTGHVEIYRKEGTSPRAGFDPSSFPIIPAPTSEEPARPQQTASTGSRMPVIPVPVKHGPGTRIERGATATPAGPPTVTNTPPPNATPTFTPSRTKTPKSSPTATRTPTVTPTPTITETPTITPTPAPPFVRMQVVQWQWNFYVDPTGGPCNPPIQPPCVATNPGNEITLQVGQTYTIMIVNGDGSDVTASHGFGGEDFGGANGLPRISMIQQGQSYGPYTVIPAVAGDYPFNCTSTSCGNPEQHESMLGVIHVVP